MKPKWSSFEHAALEAMKAESGGGKPLDKKCMAGILKMLFSILSIAREAQRGNDIASRTGSPLVVGVLGDSVIWSWNLAQECTAAGERFVVKATRKTRATPWRGTHTNLKRHGRMVTGSRAFRLFGEQEIQGDGFVPAECGYVLVVWLSH